MPKCRFCLEKFKPRYSSTEKECSIECSKAWRVSPQGKAKTDNLKSIRLKKKNTQKRKVHTKKTSEFYENDTKTRKKAAKESCHAYIRERDKNKCCICCGKSLGDDFHAGHFFESGNNPLIRYDENNIHGQRADCNVLNGGDSGEYKQRLIAKIGLFEYYCLVSRKSGTDSGSPQDYKEIEVYFKNKLKHLVESVKN